MNNLTNESLGKRKILRDEEGHVIESNSGMFMCGVDLLLGTYRLIALYREENNSNCIVYYGVDSNPNETYAEKSFFEQTYASVEDGDFIVIECDDSDIKVKFEKIK